MDFYVVTGKKLGIILNPVNDKKVVFLYPDLKTAQKGIAGYRIDDTLELKTYSVEEGDSGIVHDEQTNDTVYLAVVTEITGTNMYVTPLEAYWGNREKN